MEFDDPAEEHHFRDVVTGFAEYPKDCEREIRRREASIRPQDVARLPFLATKPALMRQCAKVNSSILRQIYEPFLDHVIAHAKNKKIGPNQVYSPPHRMSKVRVTLHQIAREWSTEGASERAAAFGPLLETLESRVPKDARVAVPGCGLGRLVVETCGRGYHAQGSEFSYEMLITGDWIMNRLDTPLQVYPWFDQASNVVRFSEAARPVVFPDEFASSICQKSEGSMSIVAGEFVHMYASVKPEDKFGAVLSCFFLDTAPNLSSYLEVIRSMLVPGGLLISFGPLMWHWQPPYAADASSVDDERFAQSLELTLDEVVDLIKSHGFRVSPPQMHPGVRYNDNQAGMQHNIFDCALLVCERI